MIKFLENQYPNFTMWAVFAFAAGAALYFALPGEPVIAWPWLITILCAACFATIVYRRDKFHIVHFAVAGGAMLVALGFFYSYSYAHAIATPTIRHDMRGAHVSGVVSRLDYTDARTRVYIGDATVSSPYGASSRDAARNFRDDACTIRLSLSPDEPIPAIGARITADADLFRPAPADVRGGFDMAEWSYFHGLGATGYITRMSAGAAEPAENPHISGYGPLIQNMRVGLHDHIAVHGNDRATALADSLVLGFTNAIPADDSKFAQAAGISHVFSISGFHITLVGGWLFAFFYLIFRSIPAISRRMPARYPAMICAWIGLLAYLEISGAEVAMQRSFLMASLAFAAFMLGRNVFSLRNVALVFGALLLANPHYLMEPGFQLSFAAIFGLIWFFGDAKYEKRGWMRKIIAAIRALVLTSLVATLFTAPFIAYHFHYFPPYGLIGNLLCLPLFSFAIMPLIMIGTVTAQFGIFSPLDWGADAYGVSVAITKWISGLPFAEIPTPVVPGPALALIVFGFLCLMFVINGRRKANLFLALAPVLVALALIAFRQKPIFYATGDHGLVAFVTDDGTLQFNHGRDSGHYFTFETFESMNGQRPGPRESRRPIGKGFAGGKYRADCADKVCVYATPKWRLAYVQQFVPLYRNIEKLCDGNNSLNFIIPYFQIRAPNCAAQILNGGLVIYESGRVEYTPSGRIWHPKN
ncbi:MAG: ComEC family competence protein [Proteobacteria bacterium]|nr:ComEC family competence protein [Pseudomonadota bacterium]